MFSLGVTNRRELVLKSVVVVVENGEEILELEKINDGLPEELEEAELNNFV
jgi:hypothetical protein